MHIRCLSESPDKLSPAAFSAGAFSGDAAARLMSRARARVCITASEPVVNICSSCRGPVLCMSSSKPARAKSVICELCCSTVLASLFWLPRAEIAPAGSSAADSTAASAAAAVPVSTSFNIFRTSMSSSLTSTSAAGAACPLSEAGERPVCNTRLSWVMPRRRSTALSANNAARAKGSARGKSWLPARMDNRAGESVYDVHSYPVAGLTSGSTDVRCTVLCRQDFAERDANIADERVRATRRRQLPASSSPTPRRPTPHAWYRVVQTMQSELPPEDVLKAMPV